MTRILLVSNAIASLIETNGADLEAARDVIEFGKDLPEGTGHRTESLCNPGKRSGFPLLTNLGLVQSDEEKPEYEYSVKGDQVTRVGHFKIQKLPAGKKYAYLEFYPFWRSDLETARPEDQIKVYHNHLLLVYDIITLEYLALGRICVRPLWKLGFFRWFYERYEIYLEHLYGERPFDMKGRLYLALVPKWWRWWK